MKNYLRVLGDYLSKNIEIILVPIFFLVFILIIQYVWGYFDLPNQNDLIANVQYFFSIYGLWLIFFSSIIEAMLFLGWYFPGSLVIFLGVAATHGHPELAIQTVLTVCLGMTIGYTVNYTLGKYGWYKLLMKYGFKDELEKIEKRLKNKGILSSFVFYVMPGFGSLLSTAFGVLKYNVFTFLSFTIIMVLFWNIIWGTLVYFFGMPLFKLLTNTVTLFVVFCIYFFYVYNKQKIEENERVQNQDK